MANNNFIKTTLSLTSPICMDINDSVVRPFDSFNKKNAPFVGDQLSPFYVSRETAKEGEVTPVYDEAGNRWSLINNQLCKNGEVVNGSPTFENSYSKTEIDKEYIYTGKNNKNDTVALYRQINPTTQEIKYYCEYNNSTFFMASDASFSFAGYIAQKGDFVYFAFVKKGNIAGGVSAVLYLYKLNNNGVTLINPDGYFLQNKFIDNSWNSFSFIEALQFSSGEVGISLVPFAKGRIKERVTSHSLVCTNLDNATIYESRLDAEKDTKCFIFSSLADREGETEGILLCDNYQYQYNPTATSTPVKLFGYASIVRKELVNSVYVIKYIIKGSDKEYITIHPENQNNSENIAVSYDLYPGYYQQSVVSKVKRATDSLQFTPCLAVQADFLTAIGCSITTAEINEDTLVYNDIPQKANSKNGFYTNMNNGYPSAVVSENNNLIVAWNEIEGMPVTFENGFYYKTTNGKYFKILKDKAPIINTIMNNRYILINADNRFNAYDVIKDTWLTWSNGYNGAILFSSNLGERQFLSKNIQTLAGSINANYEITNKPFPSTIFPYIRLLGFNPQYLRYAYAPGEVIDLYYSEITPPKYIYSVKKSTVTIVRESEQIIKPNLLDILYPENPNIIYSVSLMSEIIKSYNNHDFIFESGKAYPLMYSNNYPILAYQALSFIENIKGAFVIQNSNYLLFENKIMAVQYQGTQIQGSTIVADVTGMEFIGNTSQVAFFFSKLAKKIYTFTGDVVLNELRGANVIDEVYGSFFIPADNTIIVSCKEKDGDYVYFFGSDSFLKVANAEVKNCYYGDNKIILIDAENNANKYSYFKTQDGTKLPIELQTGFFGLGNEQTAELDCWYIRVFDEDFNNGKVRVKQNVLTNIGVKSEEKTINITSSTWDRLSKSYLIRYQPRYQNGVGFQLEINSDFAIYEVVASYKPGATQLTAPTAQI